MTFRERLRELWFRIYWLAPPSMGFGLHRADVECDACGRRERIWTVRGKSISPLWRSSIGHVVVYLSSSLHTRWVCSELCEWALRSALRADGGVTFLHSSLKRFDDVGFSQRQ